MEPAGLGGAWGFPYYGRTYHLAVEPFNAPIGSLEDAERARTARRLGPGEQITARPRAGAIVGPRPFTGFA